MPGRRQGEAGSGVPGCPKSTEATVGGASRSTRACSFKGTLCPHPARAPAGRGELPPPPPSSEGSRRTCPFHCGSLCPPWRQSWIAGFLFTPDWAPLDSLYHPIPGGPQPPLELPPPAAPHPPPPKLWLS
uniref:Uncharacterized protein n=1 Tax=Sus scrofa TaxID=9823 RepID=A0A8D1M2W1_PIG